MVFTLPALVFSAYKLAFRFKDIQDEVRSNYVTLVQFSDQIRYTSSICDC